MRRRYPTLKVLGAVALAGLMLNACASRPKPLGPVATVEAPPAPTPKPPPTPEPQPAPAVAAPAGPTPGSSQDFVVNVGDHVYFDFDRYTIREDARPILDSQAAWLSRYPAVHVRIEGNCDELGTREYNFALGARRAESARQYLISHGVAAARIETVSYGKEHPLDTTGGDDGQARNRNAHTALTQGAQ